MKTIIEEQDGIFVLKCKSTGEELDVFKTRAAAELAQPGAEDYCK